MVKKVTQLIYIITSDTWEMCSMSDTLKSGAAHKTNPAPNWEGSTDCTGSRGWSRHHILHTAAAAENEKDEKFA